MHRRATVFSVMTVEEGLRIGFYYNRKNCMTKFFRLYVPTEEILGLTRELCRSDYEELLDKNVILEWDTEFKKFQGIKRQDYGGWWRGKARLTSHTT